jgi:anti-sigma B factor antagonist
MHGRGCSLPVMSATPDALDITIEDTEAGHLVRVSGELDLATAPQLSAVLLDAAGQSTLPVVLDLAGVTFIDSSALRTLVLAGRELADAGRKLQIGARSERVTKVLEMTQLDQYTEAFQVLPDELA